MTTAQRHYQDHLAPIYVWMAGGVEAAMQAGDAEVAALGLPRVDGACIVDLGAGFGMHAIPLARRGARVTAIDSSAELMRTLGELGQGLAIDAVVDDLSAFPAHLVEAPTAILCMGDTITHLPSLKAVDELVARASIALRKDGLFVTSFRDYSIALAGDERFIHVRGEEARILTCFLEYEPEHVRVHDLIHERTAEGWRSKVSHYPKLRLAPDRLIASLESHRFKVRREPGLRGMVRLVAQRC